MIRIPVDLNNIRSDGKLVASLRRATGIPNVGDVVTIVDSDDTTLLDDDGLPKVHTFATVEERHSAIRVVLTVHWLGTADPRLTHGGESEAL